MTVDGRDGIARSRRAQFGIIMGAILPRPGPNTYYGQWNAAERCDS